MANNNILFDAAFSAASAFLKNSTYVSAFATAVDSGIAAGNYNAQDAMLLLCTCTGVLSNRTDSSAVVATLAATAVAEFTAKQASLIIVPPLLVPIADKRAIGNDSGATAMPGALTISQELDWLGGTDWVFSNPSNNAQIGNFLNVNPNTAFTVGAWVECSAFADSECIRKFDASGRGFAMLLMATGKVRFFLSTAFAGSLFAEIECNGTIPPGLHLVTAAINGTGSTAGMTIHIDAVLQTSVVLANALGGGATTNTASLQMGGFGAPTRVLDAFMCNGALTTPQNIEIYNGGVPPDMNALPGTPPPIGWWRFDEDDTTAPGGIRDHSSGGHNATALGGLAPTPPIGILPIRGTSFWKPLRSGAVGFVLTSTGLTAEPVYQSPFAPIVTQIGWAPASLANSNLLTLLAAGHTAGVYEINYVFIVRTTATGSAATAQLGWTSPTIGAESKQIASGLILTASGTQLTANVKTAVIESNGSAAITLQFNAGLITAGAPIIDLYTAAKRIG